MELERSRVALCHVTVTWKFVLLGRLDRRVSLLPDWVFSPECTHTHSRPDLLRSWLGISQGLQGHASTSFGIDSQVSQTDRLRCRRFQKGWEAETTLLTPYVSTELPYPAAMPMREFLDCVD